MKGRKGLIDKGPYLVDERYMGKLTDITNAIVMDCIDDVEKRKKRIKITRTSMKQLYIGGSTVAVFHVKFKNPVQTI